MTTENEINASDESRSIDGHVSETVPEWLRCKNCKWRNKNGVCVNSDKLHERYEGDESTDDRLEYCYNEGGGFYVGPNFGCVHFSR